MGRKVYIASPYTQGDVAQNVRAAIDVAEELAQRGFVPYVPHFSHFWHMIHEHDYEFWMYQVGAWLPLCDALLRLPGESPGADREVAAAEALGVPVYYSVESLDEEMGGL